MNKLQKTLPSLSSLLPFEATARLGSVTRASAELSLTQAAVSKQIRSLEENLGMQLFERRNRAVHLSDDGEAYYRVVADALYTIGALSQDLREKHPDNEVILRSQLCEGLYWLMPRLSGFYQQYPNIDVRVSVSTRPIPETEERFDLALQTTNRDNTGTAIVFSALDSIFPICSPGYLKDNPVITSIDQLASHKLLHHKANPVDWMTLELVETSGVPVAGTRNKVISWSNGSLYTVF